MSDEMNTQQINEKTKDSFLPLDFIHKKTVIGILVAVIAIFIFLVTFLIVTMNSKLATKNEQDIALCVFKSDQEAYYKALETHSVETCSCVKDERLKNVCVSAQNDLTLYTDAFNKLDEAVCEKILDETVKESCVLAVTDAKVYKETLATNSGDDAVLATTTEIADYEKIREEHPNDVQNLINLAKAYGAKIFLTSSEGEVAVDEISKALGVLEEAKAIDSSFAEIYAVEGFLYALTIQNEKAITSYTKCLELDPKNIEALLGRGKLYSYLKMTREAIADFEKIVEVDTSKYFTNFFANVELCKLYSTDTNSFDKKKVMCTNALENTKEQAKKSEIQTILDSMQ
jgi:tetratricopeptide (TPR) repeat protein